MHASHGEVSPMTARSMKFAVRTALGLLLAGSFAAFAAQPASATNYLFCYSTGDVRLVGPTDECQIGLYGSRNVYTIWHNRANAANRICAAPLNSGGGSLGVDCSSTSHDAAVGYSYQTARPRIKTYSGNSGWIDAQGTWSD